MTGFLHLTGPNFSKKQKKKNNSVWEMGRGLSNEFRILKKRGNLEIGHFDPEDSRQHMAKCHINGIQFNTLKKPRLNLNNANKKKEIETKPCLTLEFPAGYHFYDRCI